MNIKRMLAAPGVARWAFAALAVPAMVAGILAMHFLTGLSPAAHPQHAMGSGTEMISVAHQTGDPAPDPIVDGCGADCSPEHQMAAMACLLLVVLSSVLLVFASRGPHAWISLRDMVARAGLIAVAIAPPRPPSLTFLSISRT